MATGMNDGRDVVTSASVATLCFLAVAVMLVVELLNLPGCTPAVEHRVTVPQIDTAIKALKTPDCSKPPPIPQDVVIDIKGDRVTANTGGEQLLRDYVSARDCLRGAH